MEIFVNYFINFYIFLELLQSVDSSPSFIFENLRNVKLIGQPAHGMPEFRRMGVMRNAAEYPAPLPTRRRRHLGMLVPSPYHSIYQGKRMPNDTRVYRKRFDYEPQPSGHQVYCEGSVNCVITHMAIETAGGIPVLLRGGAGYRHFVVVVRAKPYTALVGSVRAYCLSKPDDYYTEKAAG